MPSLSFWGILCYSMPSCVNPSNPCHPMPSRVNPSNPCQAVSLCQSEQSVSIRAIRAKLCQSHRHHPTRVASSSPSALFSAPLVACSSATPSQLCDAISALRHHLSSATPSQLCDTTSALRHHLSSATPSQLRDTISALRHNQLSRQENDAICAESTCGNDARGSV